MSDETKVASTKEEPVQTERVSSGPTFSPQVDIIERPGSVAVLADMPGVPRENVDVTLEEGVLTIEGRVERPAEADLRTVRWEYEAGDFHRCFTVGEGLDRDGIQATMKDGVLRLAIPKAKEHQPRRVEVKGQ